MARYINEDEFVAWVKEHWCADCQNDNGLRCRACWIDDAIDIVEEAPEADVVPKSEVDLYRKQVDELEDELASTYDKLENAKGEIETLKDNNEHLAVMLEETKAEVESIITLNSQLEAQFFEQRKEIERLSGELKAMRGAANSYKMHYEKAMEVQKEVYRLASEIKAELPSAKAELAKNVASEIFAEIEKALSENFHADCQMGDCIEDYYDNNLQDDIAKLKKKYTEGEDKPASEEKHFSPEDVRKMTNQEVREKYTAIRRSMERW